MKVSILAGRAFGIGLLACLHLTVAAQQWASTKMLTTNMSLQHQQPTARKTLKSALKDLEARYHVSFGYLDKVVKNKYTEEDLQKSQSIEEALHTLLVPLNLKFVRMKPNFYLIQQEESTQEKQQGNNNNTEDLQSNAATEEIPVMEREAAKVAQHNVDFEVTGTVTDATDNAPIPGINILVKGTSMGTTTDANGHYKMSVPDGDAVLIFSFIGYQTQEVSVGSRSVVDVVMNADTKELEEVVVVGYGTVKKTDLTGAVATVDPEQITKRGAVSPMESMQGQVAGVDISSSTGRAGAPFKIQIRGQQSLSGGEPLYVVDGVITDNINFLNPQDIERIDILKDASSTAIYGSRGAYGVVLVTTKRGASVKQKAVISYDGYIGRRKAVRLPDFMDGDKWWEYRQDSYITPAMLANPPQAYDANTGNNTTDKTELARRIAEKDYTDWPSLFIRDGTQANHWLTVSGMGDRMGYTFGAGYQEEKGNVIQEEYKRYNFKSSINHTINDHWTAGTSFNFSVTERAMGSSNALVNAFRMSPLLKPTATATGLPLIQPGKDLPYIDMTSSVNPLFDMKNSSNDTRTYYGIGNIYLQYSPVSWLNIKTTYSPRFKYEKNGKYFGTNTEGRINQLPDASISTTESFSYVWDNQVSVNKTVGDHSFNAMGLYSLNFFRDETVNASATKLPYNSGYENLGTADPTNQRAGSYYSKSTIMSYALRMNYAWKDKYLLTVSSRWDGASVLAEGYKWATFPSAAVAWKISSEDFMTDLTFVNSLKARVSYGLTGNNKNVDPYSTQITAGTTTLYDFGGTAATGYAPSGPVNKTLTWEKTREVDIGVDYQLFSARVSGTIDFYNKLTEGVLLNRQLPLETGWSGLTDNVGKVRNKGIEVTLTTVNVSNDVFTWQTSFNFSKNTNEIVELIGKNDDVGNEWFIGHPINVNYNYVFNGIWQESDRDLAISYGQLPGQARVKDFGNDGITQNDRRILGTPMPSWTGGLSTTFTFRGFDLSASLYSRQGVQVYSYFHEEFLNFEDRGRNKLDVNWYMPANNVTPQRSSNSYPQPKNGGRFWNTDHVGFYKDASFVKIKNITLGYNFPRVLLEKTKINTLRVYANVLNPFVFTKYDGFDPEWADATFTGSENGMSSITYQVGINLKF